MGHPLTLLRQVAADLTRAWPPARGYRYEFERPLPGMRSMIPDITVTDARGEVRCVVEIGYTRPEKLTYYRAQGIEDVRWYDKTGTLHSDVDVRTRIVVRQERLTPPKALRFLRIDWVGQASCETCIARELDRCFCAGTTCEACARGDVEQCGCAACVAGDRHDCSCDPDACLCDPRVPPDDAEEARIYDEHRETLVTMISNGVRVIGLLYCDECDESVVINDYFDLTCGTQGAPTICFDTPMDFLRAHHRYRYGPWAECRAALERHQQGWDPLDNAELSYGEVIALAKAYFDRDITYDDFCPWEDDRARAARDLGLPTGTGAAQGTGQG